MHRILGPIVATVLAAILGMSNDGCQEVKSPEVDGDYLAETIACSSLQPTKEAAQECRKKVNWKFGLCPSEDDIPC